MSPDKSRALGVGSTYQFQGAACRVAPWNFRVQGLYQKRLLAEAVAAVREMREHLTASEYTEQMSEIRMAKEAGVYSFGSKHCWESLDRKDNTAFLLWLQVIEFHKDFTLATATKICEEDPEGSWDAMMGANGANPTTPAPDGVPGTTDPGEPEILETPPTPSPASGGTSSSPPTPTPVVKRPLPKLTLPPSAVP